MEDPVEKSHLWLLHMKIVVSYATVGLILKPIRKFHFWFWLIIKFLSQCRFQIRRRTLQKKKNLHFVFGIKVLKKFSMGSHINPSFKNSRFESLAYIGLILRYLARYEDLIGIFSSFAYNKNWISCTQTLWKIGSKTKR